MNCRTFRRNLRRGIQNDLMAIHVEECSFCKARLQAITAIRSDQPAERAVPKDQEELERLVVDTIMGHLERKSFENTGASRRVSETPAPLHRPIPRFVLAAAAVALIVVTAGITTVINRAVPESPAVAGSDTGVTALATNDTGDTGRPADGEPGVPGGTHGDSPNTVEVHLILEAPDARSVSVAGGWNGWDPTVHHLSDENGDGIWEVRFAVEADREYEYQFVIDERIWTEDPQSPFQVDDGFGGVNSILDV